MIPYKGTVRAIDIVEILIFLRMRVKVFRPAALFKKSESMGTKGPLCIFKLILVRDHVRWGAIAPRIFEEMD